MRILSSHPPPLSSTDYTKRCPLGKFPWTWQIVAWLLAIFSAFPEYRDVCGSPLKGPNWLVYNSQTAKPRSTSIHIPLGNLYNRSSRSFPDQRMLGLWQSQRWHQQQLSSGPGCPRAAYTTHCHQGHPGTQTKDNDAYLLAFNCLSFLHAGKTAKWSLSIIGFIRSEKWKYQ